MPQHLNSQLATALRPLDVGEPAECRAQLENLRPALDLVSPGLTSALIAAVDGDADAASDWLFGLPRSFAGPIAWLSRTTDFNGTTVYLWFVGRFHPLSAMVATISSRARHATKFEGEACVSVPPLVAFIEPTATCREDSMARAGAGEAISINDLGIIQPARDSNGAPRDIDRRLVLNVPFLERAIHRTANCVARICTPPVAERFNGCLQNAALLGMLHAEFHNLGHFLGPWPLDPGTKSVRSYEPIEDTRACLGAIELASRGGLDASKVEELSLVVALTRMLEYAARSYVNSNRSWPAIREIVAGALIAERLFEGGTIWWMEHDSRELLDIDILKLPGSLLRLLGELHTDEQVAIAAGSQGLNGLASKYLARAFPNRTLPSDVERLFSAAGAAS